MHVNYCCRRHPLWWSTLNCSLWDWSTLLDKCVCVLALVCACVFVTAVKRQADSDTIFCFNFVKICTDLCIASWARQAGRKGRGKFRRCWQIKISHGKMTRASAEGIGLPQTWGGWCCSSLDCVCVCVCVWSIAQYQHKPSYWNKSFYFTNTFTSEHALDKSASRIL